MSIIQAADSTSPLTGHLARQARAGVEIVLWTIQVEPLEQVALAESRVKSQRFSRRLRQPDADDSLGASSFS